MVSESQFPHKIVNLLFTITNYNNKLRAEIAEGCVHPRGDPGANLKSISHRCYLQEVAFGWDVTKETIYLPLGCLQGGVRRDAVLVAWYSEPQILSEMCFNLQLSGNEVYYTIFKILLVKIILCSKLHCQKVLN